MIEYIRQNYIDDQKEITRRLRIIERHENKIEKIREKGWCETLIAPIMEAIKVRFPDLNWGDRMSTMGFKCRVPMFGKDDKGELIVCITFVPEELTKGEISFETGELIDPAVGYDTHGFNLKCEIINDIKQVFNHIQSKLDLVES